MLHGRRALAGEKLAGQRANKKEQVHSLLLPARLLLVSAIGSTDQEPADKGGMEFSASPPAAQSKGWTWS